MTSPLPPPKSIIACGSEGAACAGETILRQGGNAVDAAVTAVLTSFATEPVLTGPFGGGFALTGGSGRPPTCYQFFANAPGLTPGGAAPLPEDFLALEVTFGPANQVFHVGRGSTALPLMLPGLLRLQKHEGTLPLAQILKPAVDAAKQGVLLPPQIAGIFKILEPILLHTPQTRALFAQNEALLRPHQRFHSPELAGFLQGLSEETLPGILENLAGHFGPPHGRITAEDIRATPIETPPPLDIGLGGYRVHFNPPPSSGGVLVAFGLKLLERVSPRVWDDPDATLLHFFSAMVITQHAREQTIDPLLLARASVEEITGKALSNEFIESWLPHFSTIAKSGTRGQLSPPADLGHTTHVSVMDSEGRMCSITTSNGEGSGHVVPGTGAMTNNFMGEEDIHPQGFHQLPPGAPLTSMMCPTLVFLNGHPVAALGTGGSNRIRTALLQVLTRHLLGKQSLTKAVNAPRLHYEGGEVCLETTGHGSPFTDAAILAFESKVGPLTLFREPNIFFGGVHAVGPGGQGAGDPRRGGVVRAPDA